MAKRDRSSTYYTPMAPLASLKRTEKTLMDAETLSLNDLLKAVRTRDDSDAYDSFVEHAIAPSVYLVVGGESTAVKQRLPLHLRE